MAEKPTNGEFEAMGEFFNIPPEELEATYDDSNLLEPEPVNALAYVVADPPLSNKELLRRLRRPWAATNERT